MRLVHAVNGEAKVCDLDDGGGGVVGIEGEHENVARCQVAVHHIHSTKCDHGPADLAQHRQLVLQRDLVPPVLEKLVQGAVIGELREQQLLGAFGAHAQVAHEALVPT